MAKVINEKSDNLFTSKKTKEKVSKKGNAKGFDLDKISNGTENKSPILITNVKIKHLSNFSAAGQLTIENNYTSTAVSLELDFGVSQKRVKCSILPGKFKTLTLSLTEPEADNSLTFLVDGINRGLTVSKAVFTDGYKWTAKRE